MDKEKEILSSVIIFSKYAKHLKQFKRRETWNEIVNRNIDMHVSKFPHLEKEIREAYELVFSKKVLPSMRSLQFAGKPIQLNPARIFNCCYLPMEDEEAFREVMFLLLSGTGVGYSVQRSHVAKLPEIKKPIAKKHRRYVIGDSIEGWSDAIKTLMKSYFNGGYSVQFIYDDIRPKGAELVTSGGKAPGPEPLRICMTKIESLLREKKTGDKLSSIEVHDINCHIADAVLAGGIRRAAMIALFSMDDPDMLSAKSGNWWELNPQRGRANNSAVVLRPVVAERDFFSLWDKIKASGSGEPGVYFTNDKEWGTNPCCEISLRPYQMCNLVEINASNITSQSDYNKRAWAASFIGTLQASYFDFHYLRDIWRKNTQKDALLGVSMTGIASMEVFKYDIEEAVSVVRKTNEEVAKSIGINKSARLTCVKPAGTTSLVLGTSSGIHAWHSDFYKRRMRISKSEALYTYLAINHPQLLEDDKTAPDRSAIICVPQKAPEGSVTRKESAIELLERVKEISSRWVKPGHNDGPNTHNVSATISIDHNRHYGYAEGKFYPGFKEDPGYTFDEWSAVGEWMWRNREYYNGLSVLPYDGGTYVQPPFEDCNEEEYNELAKGLEDIDLSKVVEMYDLTDLKGEVACGPGGCEVK